MAVTMGTAAADELLEPPPPPPAVVDAKLTCVPCPAPAPPAAAVLPLWDIMLPDMSDIIMDDILPPDMPVGIDIILSEPVAIADIPLPVMDAPSGPCGAGESNPVVVKDVVPEAAVSDKVARGSVPAVIKGEDADTVASTFSPTP